MAKFAETRVVVRARVHARLLEVQRRMVEREERQVTLSEVIDELLNREVAREDARAELDRIDALLHEAGNEYPLGARGVSDVIAQRDGYLDELKRFEGSESGA